MSSGGLSGELEFATYEERVNGLLAQAEQARSVSALLVIVGKLARVALSCIKRARELWEEARHDWLTGLLNLKGITEAYDRLLQEMCHPNPRAERLCAVVVFSFDIEKFKTYNDTQSWAAGNELLQRVASLLVGVVRARDVVARIGGDEFAVVIPVMAGESPEAVQQNVGQRLRERIATYVDPWDGIVPKRGEPWKLSMRWRSLIVTPEKPLPLVIVFRSIALKRSSG